MAKDIYLDGYTQNRELSWLRFNERVLEEAVDERVPLLERLKFISIFTSNLDEFFMIRVGSLFDMNLLDPSAIDKKSGLTPMEQLKKIYKEVDRLIVKREEILKEVEERLRVFGISSLEIEELEPNEHKFVKNYFKNSIEPILSPQIVDSHHPFPHFLNKHRYVGLTLKHKSNQMFGVIPLPTSLPEVVFLPGEETRFILVSRIVQEYASTLFDVYETTENVVFSVTRNADINPDDVSLEDSFEDIVGKKVDFRKKMRKLLNKRKKLAAVRLELSNEISSSFSKYLREKLLLEENQVYISRAPFTMRYAFSLENSISPQKKKNLLFPNFSPQISGSLMPGESITKQVMEKDLMLSFPYESMDPFLDLVKEASTDPDVVSIKITIYRLSKNSKLVEYLREAAENSKEVTVVIELRARFDEQSNIDYSEELEEAGCTVIYGFEGYKVHSKLCLITRMKNGQVSYLTNVATGNYNENTAKLYGDLSLITADQEIGADANEFFKNMAIGNIEGQYKRLLVAPLDLKPGLLQLIQEQIELKSQGYIVIKVNSLTDAELMAKLSEASRAGVQVQLIIRGICCLLPGIGEKTDQIVIRSIVGRFLEHARIYSFGKGENQKLYISSADFMTRNTERRVEVAAPVLDKDIKNRINEMLALQMKDNVKARLINPKGKYETIDNGADKISSQKQQILDAEDRAELQMAKIKEQRRIRQEQEQLLEKRRKEDLKKREEIRRIRERRELEAQQKTGLLEKIIGLFRG